MFTSIYHTCFYWAREKEKQSNKILTLLSHSFVAFVSDKCAHICNMEIYTLRHLGNLLLILLSILHDTLNVPIVTETYILFL